MANKIVETFNKFPRVYWVTQFFELMERGAYYTMTPILGYYALYNAHMSPWLANIIFFFLWPIQYGVPIVSGAMAEKIGYKKQMTFAFIFLTAAYIALAVSFNTVTFIIAIMAVGVGIGSYKPLISATIAKCTTDADRNLAYSIYYWVVNLAAFVFAMGFVLLEFGGFLSPSTYRIVFIVDTIFVAVNIPVALFIFKEIPRSGKVRTVRDVMNNISIAFKDKKFVTMVILVSFFWMLYSTMLTALPLIIMGFHFGPKWFTPMMIGLFNPLTIIALGIPIGKFCEKIESLKAVIGGVLLYFLGLVVIGFFLNPAGVIVGSIISSIGEFMLAPGYLSFVSKLAPKEKVSAYIGCNFLSSMAGLGGGALFIGILSSYLVFTLFRPIFFYGILMAMSLLLVAAFMVYYQFWGQDIINRAKRIREMEEGPSDQKTIVIPKSVSEPFYFKVLDFKAATIVPLILIPIVLISTWAMGTNIYYPPDDGDKEETFSLENYDVVAGEGMTEASPSPLSENSEATTAYTASPSEGQLVKSITLTLTWTDEEDYQRVGFGRTWENQPDEFSFEASLAANPDDPTTTAVNYSSPTVSNTHGNPGVIETTITFDHTKKESKNGTGDWQIVIECGSCGDKTNPYSALLYTDTGNTYELTITTEYYTPKTAEKK